MSTAATGGAKQCSTIKSVRIATDNSQHGSGMVTASGLGFEY